MSFSTDIKSELAERPIKRDCCAASELLAIICFGSHIRNNSLLVRTENQDLASRIQLLCKRVFKRTATIIHKPTPGLMDVEIADETTLPEVLDYFKLIKNARDMKNFVSFQMESFLSDKKCCHRAVLRGAFLAAGSCAEPERRYHLEISTNHFRLSRELIVILEDFEIFAKSIVRKSNHVIYLKGGDYIHDYLGYAGAQKSVMLLEEARVTKDFKNTINRRTNFEFANLSKAIEAGAPQIEAIQKIQSTIGIEALDDSLKEIAYLRVENPEASLKDLCSMMREPISKSGLNHRLKKLMEIAEKIRGGKL